MIATALIVTGLGVASLFAYTEHNQVADLQAQIAAESATQHAIDKANTETMAHLMQDLGQFQPCAK